MILSHLERFKIVSDIQHGSRQSYSCETQLRITLEDLAKNLNHGKQSDIILLDFANAFDTVPHQRRLNKCRFKLGRLKNSFVSSLNGKTWYVFPFFKADIYRVNAVRWVNGGIGGVGVGPTHVMTLTNIKK